MSKTWYLRQNPDVRESGIPAFLHFIKYGRKELRNWKEPKWFRSAFGLNGWVQRTSKYFFTHEIIDKKYLNKNYKEIGIYRPGSYNKEIKIIKSEILDSYPSKKF